MAFSDAKRTPYVHGVPKIQWTSEKRVGVCRDEGRFMGKYEKLLQRLVRGDADSSIAFDELCQLLERLGFDHRTRGSHHIFRKPGIEEKINLQRDGKNAKGYQVRQVRMVIVKYGLGVNS